MPDKKLVSEADWNILAGKLIPSTIRLSRTNAFALRSKESKNKRNHVTIALVNNDLATQTVLIVHDRIFAALLI